MIVNLFDYNCPHCRLCILLLLEAQRRLGDQLGIVCLPMPMDSQCNPFVPWAHPPNSRHHGEPRAPGGERSTCWVASEFV